MQNFSNSEKLAHLQASAQCEDWEQLSQDLQLLLLEDWSTDPNAAIELLNLAMQVLEWGSFQDRWEIAKVFPNLGMDAIAPLIDLLKDDEAEPEAQWFAIRILGSFNHPRVITTLIDLLKASPSEDLSSMAVSVLASLGSDAVSVLEDLLNEDSTRLFATQALGRIRRSETVPLLMRVVQDQDAEVRAIAIEALSSFHSAEITKILLAALKDVAVPVRLAAVAGLGFCTGDDLVTHLRPLLFDLNLEVCRQTAIALGRLATPEAATALNQVLKSKHTPESLAIDIVRALGWSNALNDLEAALLNSSEPVQLEIIQTLGRIEVDKSQAASILVNASNSIQSPVLRQAIALSLGQLGNVDILDSLIAMLADRDDGVRLHVIAALKTLDAELTYRRLEQLSQLESSESELGQGIAIALQEWSF